MLNSQCNFRFTLNHLYIKIIFKFVCLFQVGGDPSPDIRWSRQGRERLPDGVQIVSDRGMSLHSVHPGDQGVYVCSASNKAGSITASAMLRVQVKLQMKFRFFVRVASIY